MKIVQRIVAVAALMLATMAVHGKDMEDEPVLGGYCPVAYIALGKAVEGKSDHAVMHEGKTYLFVNADAATAFGKEPAKYLPAYDGYCAYGMSLGKKFDSDPTVFKVVDGRLFLNKNAEVGELFDKDTKALISKADAAWAEMK